VRIEKLAIVHLVLSHIGDGAAGIWEVSHGFSLCACIGNEPIIAAVKVERWIWLGDQRLHSAPVGPGAWKNVARLKRARDDAADTGSSPTQGEDVAAQDVEAGKDLVRNVLADRITVAGSAESSS
jgi:hypothetical protein